MNINIDKVENYLVLDNFLQYFLIWSKNYSIKSIYKSKIYKELGFFSIMNLLDDLFDNLQQKYLP